MLLLRCNVVTRVMGDYYIMYMCMWVWLFDGVAEVLDFVVVVLLHYVHGKQLWSYQDGQLT